MVEALIKRKRTGELYKRTKKVEKALRDAIKQTTQVIVKRAAVSDQKSSDFLPSECIVHLIRKANREKDTRMVSALFPILMGRCYRNLKSAVSETFPNAEDVRDEILFTLCDLFAEDATGESVDELDYHECMFNSAFKALRLMAIRKHSAEKRGGTATIEELPDLDTYQGSNTVFNIASQEQRIFISQFIQSLPPDEQKALILCHVIGRKIESTDPMERTAASICGVSGRTIRTRLASAQAKLKHLHKEL